MPKELGFFGSFNKFLNRRQYALGLKNAKHDVVIACQDGEDMLEWMKSSTKHQQHLYKWDKFADENCELDISGDLEQRPLSPLFTSKVAFIFRGKVK